MPHDADDFGLHVEAREIDALADGILIRKIGAREDIVDVDNDRRTLVILRRDEAAALKSDSHGLLEAGFN